MPSRLCINTNTHNKSNNAFQSQLFLPKLIVPQFLLIFLSLFYLLALNNNGCESANILSVSFFSSKSHTIAFEPLLRALVERGHNLTIISPEYYSGFDLYDNNNDNRRQPSSGVDRAGQVTQIIGKRMEDFGNINFIQARLEQNYLAEPWFFSTILEPLCRSYLEMPAVQSLLIDNNNVTTTRKFDLIIGSAFMNYCSLGYISQFDDTPFILTVPFSPLAITAQIFGAPSPNSFVPVPIFSSSTHEMSFRERVQNMIISTFLPLSFHWYVYPKVELVYREILNPQVPSVTEIQRKASLLLMNSHFTLNYPRPTMPDMIEVGGMHCRPGKQLSDDLDKFLSGSGPDGFIYLSFGSVIKSIDMPASHIKIFTDVFSHLKQRVLWKWENESLMEGLPSNVKVSHWIPQQDVLAHPQIKLFITHGGLLSAQEAVYHGVPLIGLPIFADQDWNMAQAKASGIAITLDFRTLTEDSLVAAINRIIAESSFRENVRVLSEEFRDRPLNPLDLAVYWTEYVLRHKGSTPRLRSAARNLNLLQYYSVDVILFLAFILCSILYLSYKLNSFLFRLVRIVGSILLNKSSFSNTDSNSIICLDERLLKTKFD